MTVPPPDSVREVPPAPSGIRTAHFWFDPSCPYTWLTAQWLLEVAKVRPVRVRWHLMSLSVLNEGRDDDPEGDPEGYLWVPVRICAAVRQEYGEEALARFYSALWANESAGEPDWLNDLQDSLEKAGLPRTLSDAGMTTAYDEAVRTSHTEAVSLVGTHVGTPVIAVDSGSGRGSGSGRDGDEGAGGDRGEGEGERRTAFFGPVISRVPTGEEAARLWDGVLLVASTPGFHELQASRGTAR